MANAYQSELGGDPAELLAAQVEVARQVLRKNYAAYRRLHQALLSLPTDPRTLSHIPLASMSATEIGRLLAPG